LSRVVYVFDAFGVRRLKRVSEADVYLDFEIGTYARRFFPSFYNEVFGVDYSLVDSEIRVVNISVWSSESHICI